MYRYTSSLSQNPLIIDQIKVIIKDLKEVPKLATFQLDLFQINQLKEIQQIEQSWKTNDSLTKMSREFTFSNFKESFAFMSSVSELSDKMEHYPKWYNKGNKVIVEITTPNTGLTIKDMLLAFTMDRISTDIINQNIDYISQLSKLTLQPSVLLNQWNNNYSKLEEKIISEIQNNVNQF